MIIFCFILTFFMLLKTISYGIFEYKHQNKSGAYIIFILAFFSFISANVIVFFR